MKDYSTVQFMMRVVFLFGMILGMPFECIAEEMANKGYLLGGPNLETEIKNQENKHTSKQRVAKNQEEFRAGISDDFWHNEPQVEIGKKNIVVDSLGNIIGIPSKVVLLNPKMENHNVSSQTIQNLKDYIASHPKQMSETKIRINQFAPIGEFKRLVKNKKMKWWWRVFPGIPTTIISSAGRLLGGDHYNPYTNTINIYSDVSAVVLHEAGHANDFSQYYEDGTAGLYAAGRMLVPVTLYQEHAASEAAIEYLKEKNDKEGEQEAYRVLIPAYGTYVGGATGIPFANAIGAGLGHIVSFVPRKNSRLSYEALDEAKWSSEVVTDLRSDPLANSLLCDWDSKSPCQ